MYHRILLPTDGSEASRHAVQAGVDFAKSLGASVVAMTAVPPFHTFTANTEMIESVRGEYEAASRERARYLLDEIAAVAQGAGVACEAVQTSADSPYESIVATAREQGCDLIVMASHGRKGLAGMLLGSETQKVLTHSTIPVMVYRQGGAAGQVQEGKTRRILVPTDGSALAQQAVPAAIEFARACHGEIVALSVGVPEIAFQSVEGAMVVDPGRHGEELLEHAREHAKAVADRAGAAGVGCSVVVRLSTDAAEAIVDTAREEGCDLIFIASHGRRGLSRLLAGSVTQSVLEAAPIPVMVLRAPASAGVA